MILQPQQEEQSEFFDKLATVLQKLPENWDSLVSQYQLQQTLVIILYSVGILFFLILLAFPIRKNWKKILKNKEDIPNVLILIGIIVGCLACLLWVHELCLAVSNMLTPELSLIQSIIRSSP